MLLFLIRISFDSAPPSPISYMCFFLVSCRRMSQLEQSQVQSYIFADVQRAFGANSLVCPVVRSFRAHPGILTISQMLCPSESLRDRGTYHFRDLSSVVKKRLVLAGCRCRELFLSQMKCGQSHSAKIWPVHSELTERTTRKPLRSWQSIGTVEFTLQRS